MNQEPTDLPGRQIRLESTAELLGRARGGDEVARNRLFEVFAPLLRRWACGRMPFSARGLSDTDDLVQITLLRVLDHVDRFEARRPGAFLAYLRRSLLNNMRNEIRRASARPAGSPPKGELLADAPSPLERAIGGKALHAYEEALERLSENQRAAVILRIELGCKHREIAEILESPSTDAARMLVSRAIAQLAGLIDEQAIRDATR